ncbi:MAG TPA: CotH kinase family protein [Myxococcota bacterium]|nr:CotH kinase family protein [Myxococcota bacterium]
MVLALLSCTDPSVPSLPVDSDSIPIEDPDDSGVEDVPGVAEGICRIELDCGQAIPDEPKIDCDLEIADAEGLVLFDGEAGVEIRGRSSSGFPKKQYAVELRRDGEALEVDLFGMGAESDWVLNGAWIDRALTRNKYGYDLYQDWSPEHYGPESRTCQLRLDGADWGIYFLVERVKRDAARIDIDEEGFVLKLDDQGGIYPNDAVGFGTWAPVHPEAPTTEEISAIQQILASWQAAILDDPDAIFDVLDRDSAIDFVLLQEFMKNNDAYYLSVHLWRDASGLMAFTPWDLDLTFGQPTYNDNVVPTGWILYRPTWVARMTSAEGFSEALAARWFELREGTLSDEAALARFEAQRELLGDAAYENFEVWVWDDIDFLGGYLPVVEDYDAEVEKIREWIPARLAWIDENIEQY